MKLKFLFLFLVLLTGQDVVAQQDGAVAVRIDGKPIYLTELEEAFAESNARLDMPETIDDFLPRYIDFRLNLLEARAERLDTLPSFRREYDRAKWHYGTQMLRDTAYNEIFLKEIYNRMQTDCEVNHVLIPFGTGQRYVFPADTLPAYTKALELRRKLIKSNFRSENFYTKNEMSRNARTDVELENGYVGWVAPFMFSYAVENAIYTLPEREISMPIRTEKGYHLVQVLNRRPARGQLNIVQLYFGFTHLPIDKQQTDSVKQIADKAYKEILKTGDGFETYCINNGQLPDTVLQKCESSVLSYASSLVPPNFTEAAYNLKNQGDMTAPIMTSFGFHIIKRFNEIPQGSFEKMRTKLMERIASGDRFYYLNKEKSDLLYKEYSFSVDKRNYGKLQNLANTRVPVSRDFAELVPFTSDTLFTIDGVKVYTFADFRDYLMGITDTQQSAGAFEIESPNSYGHIFRLSSDILDYYFYLFSSYQTELYMKETVDVKYPEVGTKMKKIADGLLLYEVKKKHIWDKAGKDEEGLDKLFRENRQAYMWDSPKYKGIIVLSKSEDAKKKAQQLVSRTKGIKEQEALIRKTLNSDSVNVRIETGIWTEGQNPYVDCAVFGAAEPSPQKLFPEWFVAGELLTAPQSFEDDRSRVEVDYQELLTREWETCLQKKYKVETDDKVINSLR